MWERTTISEGRLVSLRASANAARSAPRSFGSATCCTCQPFASKRAPVSSRSKLKAVVPSIVMWLSS